MPACERIVSTLATTGLGSLRFVAMSLEFSLTRWTASYTSASRLTAEIAVCAVFP
jgi:hypothetical protein